MRKTTKSQGNDGNGARRDESCILQIFQALRWSVEGDENWAYDEYAFRCTTTGEIEQAAVVASTKQKTLSLGFMDHSEFLIHSHG